MKGITFLLFLAVASANVSMFEISTRPWLYLLSQKYGTQITSLSDIPVAEFKAIADQGFDYVWMMGIWELGAYGLHFDQTNPQLQQQYSQTLPGWTQDDVIGSPYAITEYTCNPTIGSDSDIANMKQTLNSLGLKLMLDFVPNHSAVDCNWTTTNPSYYIRAPKGSQPPYDPNIYLPSGIAYGSICGGCGPWLDTAQFNYWDNDLRQARTNQVLKVASLADAIRCDVAYLALNQVIQDNWSPQLTSWGYTRPATEWWSDVISATKSKYPDVVFLAEVYQPWPQAMQDVGFDYTYDKQLYDKLGNGDLDDIRSWLTSNTQSFISKSAHFVSNHDELRAVSYFGSWWRADAAALLTFTLPGMRFYWMGQFQGFSARLLVQLRREATQTPIQDVTKFYNSLLNITNTDVFNLGTWTYVDVIDNQGTGWRLIAYRWEYNNQKRLCVINYSDQNGGGTIVLPNAQAINGNDTIPVTDLLSGNTYYRSASGLRSSGLNVVVNSWYAQIFSY